MKRLKAADKVIHRLLSKRFERAHARLVHGEGMAVTAAMSRSSSSHGGNVAVLRALARGWHHRVGQPCLLPDLNVLRLQLVNLKERCKNDA